jgi:chorismate dehydratase
MSRVRLGAVSYLNARPCVVGLDRDPRFDLRFDLPSRCASLLHADSIDVGLIPSIEYLRGPRGAAGYGIVPDVAIASTGQVASVALYTTRPMEDVRSIALDTSSRTSVALTRVLCARAFHIDPRFEPSGPDLPTMLGRCDAALLIGDAALLLDHAAVRLKPVRLNPDTASDDTRPSEGDEAPVTAGTSCPDAGPAPLAGSSWAAIEKIDLGEVWTATTGLPFVYAFWAGRLGSLAPDEVSAIQAARDAGVADSARVAREYFGDPALHDIGMRYLRDNIKYHLGDNELAGLERFYRYAAELGLVPEPAGLRLFEAGRGTQPAKLERLVPHE